MELSFGGGDVRVHIAFLADVIVGLIALSFCFIHCSGGRRKHPLCFTNTCVGHESLRARRFQLIGGGEFFCQQRFQPFDMIVGFLEFRLRALRPRPRPPAPALPPV